MLGTVLWQIIVNLQRSLFDFTFRRCIGNCSLVKPVSHVASISQDTFLQGSNSIGVTSNCSSAIGSSFGFRGSSWSARTGHLSTPAFLILFIVATRSISPPLKIKLSTLHWNLSSIAAGNHYHTIMFYSRLMLSLQLGRLPDIWLPDTKSIWCKTKIKPYIAWK